MAKKATTSIKTTDIRPFFQTTILKGKPTIKLSGKTLLAWFDEVNDRQPKGTSQRFTPFLINEDPNTWILLIEHRSRPTWLTHESKNLVDLEHDIAIIFEHKSYYFVHSNCSIVQSVLENYLDERGLKAVGVQTMLRIIGHKDLQFRTLGIHNIFSAGGTAPEGKAYYGRDSKYSLSPSIDGGYGFNYCLASEHTVDGGRKPFGCSVRKNKVWQTWLDGIDEFKVNCQAIATIIGKRSKGNRMPVLVEPTEKAPEVLDPIGFYMDYVVQSKGMIAIRLNAGAFSLGWFAYLSDSNASQIVIESPDWGAKSIAIDFKRASDGMSFAIRNGDSAEICFADDIEKLKKKTIPLVDYLNQNRNFTMLFSAGFGYRDGLYWQDNRFSHQFDSIDTSLSWDTIDIKKESKTAGFANSIADKLESYFSKVVVGINDDGSNEVADFVIIDEVDGKWRFILIHSKFSAQSTPGLRIGDLQVVCAQALKNMRYFVPGIIGKRIDRLVTRQFRNPTLSKDQLLKSFEDRIADPQTVKECWIVQPGISRAALQGDSKNKIHILLNSVESLCQNNGIEFKLICSK